MRRHGKRWTPRSMIWKPTMMNPGADSLSQKHSKSNISSKMNIPHPVIARDESRSFRCHVSKPYLEVEGSRA